VLRGIGPDGKEATVAVFAAGLTQPFGIAFYPPGPNPQYVYVANTGSVIRFPYRNSHLKERGAAETIILSTHAFADRFPRSPLSLSRSENFLPCARA
jgi:glucose/arabinose dehydrogenase